MTGFFYSNKPGSVLGFTKGRRKSESSYRIEGYYIVDTKGKVIKKPYSKLKKQMKVKT